MHLECTQIFPSRRIRCLYYRSESCYILIRELGAEPAQLRRHRKLAFKRCLKVSASSTEGQGLSRARIDKAAAEFAKGLGNGKEADDLVAQELGLRSASDLSDLQEKYKDKIKDKLEERAEELRRANDQTNEKFSRGKWAYERGNYKDSAYWFTRALDDEGPFSKLGGEIQLWLALAYEACGQGPECIELYKQLEKTHPLPGIRKQAGELRFIMEAPKLQIAPDEKIEIPVLSQNERFAPDRKSFATRPVVPVKSQRPKTFEEKFWEEYTPPSWAPNRYVLVASLAVCLGLAWYSIHVKDM